MIILNISKSFFKTSFGSIDRMVNKCHKIVELVTSKEKTFRNV